MINASFLLPVPPEAIIRDPDWNIFGGTAVPFENHWYRFFARWHKDTTHWGWATHSEIGCVVGDNPIGPWSEVHTVLGCTEANRWGSHAFHNPAIIFSEGKFWLFYTANYGNGEFWDHRNHQRIGVASADHPLGPWKRCTEPIVDVTPGSWDHFITACPTVARGPDGLYRMIYKGVSNGPLPFGGTVRMGLATAEHPAGPWTKQNGNFFCVEGVQFTSDDNYLWFQDGLFRAIVKDYGGHYQSKAKEALVLFTSPNALDWKLASPDPVLTTFHLTFGNERRGPFHRLEQPHLIFDPENRPIALCLSIKEQDDKVDEDLCYTVQVPLSSA